MKAITYLVAVTLVVSLVLLGCTAPKTVDQNVSTNPNSDQVLTQSSQELNSMMNESDLAVPSDLDVNDLNGIENSINESDLN